MSDERPAKAGAAPQVDRKPSPTFITDCYRMAVDRMRQTFTERRPLAMLIGEDASGADFIVSRFVEGLDGIDGGVAVARVTEVYPDATAALRKIVHEFGYDSSDMDFSDLEEVFRMFMSLQKMHFRRTVICIEETHDNESWLPHEVRRLVDFETEGDFGLMVVLAGGPDLDEQLTIPPLSALPSNSGPRIALEPFTLAETTEYVRRRIESGGDEHFGPMFESDAITMLQELTGGVPDVISKVCAKCLKTAEKDGSAHVTSEMVIGAAKSRRPRQAKRASQSNGAPQPKRVPQSKGAPQSKRTPKAKRPPPPLPAATGGRLIVKLNGDVVQEQVIDRGHLVIGRDERCEIHLPSSSVSRRHAKVVNSSIGVAISDLGSTNGTFVNGVQIEEHMLEANDSIDIGECRLEYVADDDSA